jgi:hypothetical protein
MPRLELYTDYSRQDVHDIFAPDAPFTKGAGLWGMQGIVRLEDRPGDFVFFVTFGRRQGDHEFDESVTLDGVLTWQSQPHQALDDETIGQFVSHDDETNSMPIREGSSSIGQT